MGILALPIVSGHEAGYDWAEKAEKNGISVLTNAVATPIVSLRAAKLTGRSKKTSRT